MISTVELHPTRAGALTAIVGGTGGLDQPMVMLDFGFGAENPEKVRHAIQTLSRLGLRTVAGFEEPFYPNEQWFYRLTIGKTEVDHQIRITATKRPQYVVYDGILVTKAHWHHLESQTKSVLLIAGNFSMIQKGMYKPGFDDRAESVVQNLMSSGGVVGAAIRQAGNTRRPLR